MMQLSESDFSAYLEEDILEGLFKPAEKLEIAKLQQRYNVSREGILKALLKLKGDSLVESANDVDFFVTEVTDEEVIDIYKTYSYLEQLATKLAIERGDAKWEKEIKETLKALTEEEHNPSIDSDNWFRCNYAFHYAIVKACGSKALLKLRCDFYNKLKRCSNQLKTFAQMQLATVEDHLDRNNDEHRAIAKAVLARDPKALELINGHIMGHSKEMVLLLKKAKMIN